MLIDWFTVGAQVLNFVVLVWLLKRFLYKPVLNAIDAREKRVAAEAADADLQKTEIKSRAKNCKPRTTHLKNSAPHCSPRRSSMRRPRPNGCWVMLDKRPTL